MARNMEIVPSGELQKQFGRYSDEAMIRPVGVSRNGRLRRRERVAGRVEDLDEEILEALRAVEPPAECERAEARLGSP